ncbi:hypothetical protein RhiirA4_469775 [Rhizophagus irregularis]|uniref:Uncharacterized protein n=1 Tax=Rhizophagus irregularis TaxID=588596 RepID=A0A2I1H051_9GLOM|nr:hypothetical protein RhiirA4_469775 [Rhizophagus irregularis]
MEEKFLEGGSNIAIAKNDQYYFFRMFDAKLDATAIKKRYEWQAFKKLEDQSNVKEYAILKLYNLKYGGHFSKIIKINKIKYILIYFNNESDFLKAIYKSTMEEDVGKGLQMKGQDELIDENGTTLEEHEELDNLNNNFKERLEKIEKSSSLPVTKDKRKAEDTEDLDDKTNGNKKRIVAYSTLEIDRRFIDNREFVLIS